MRTYVLFVGTTAALIVIAPTLSSAMPMLAASAIGTATSAAPSVEKIQYGWPYGYYRPYGYYGYYKYYLPYYGYGYYGYYRPYRYYYRYW